ncbi:Sulfatase [Cetobacterium ceti]|uniref:Sulfatase n=1 Tax=Cetobacterium ceti TaxID=180163 RepID=A0A1T4MT42_9FUSO|nr:sulfatase [Cetobacterium ceti]SJZ70071.1 Sulfatase [Cetobacterium ceti]
MKKPNLLFLFADQWRRNAIGFMNKEEVLTPNLDNFSKEAMTFTNAYSTCPLCSPSRATILTGKYPISHGVITNCKPNLDNVYLKENEITIGDVLKKEGYSTGYIGKWHLDDPEAQNGNTPISGAKNWDAYTPPGPKRHGFDFWYSYGADDNHFTPHYWNNSPEQIKVNKWSVEHETDIALDFISKNKDDNFALFVSWNPPHTPLDQIPQEYVDLYKDIDIKIRENVVLDNIIDHPKTIEPFSFTREKYIDMVKRYYGAITGIDINFQRIIKYLKDNNLFEDTIVVVTADHGEMLCSHGLWSKHVWYDESLSVPFIVSYGNNIKYGFNETVLSGVDIMPTLLSILNINIPNSVEGKDLSLAFQGNYIENTAVTMCYPGNQNLIKTLKKEGKNPLAYGWRSVISKDETYVYFNSYDSKSPQEEFIYKNKEDEYQLNPIYLDKNENKWRGILKTWAENFKDPIFKK